MDSTRILGFDLQTLGQIFFQLFSVIILIVVIVLIVFFLRRLSNVLKKKEILLDLEIAKKEKELNSANEKMK